MKRKTPKLGNRVNELIDKQLREQPELRKAWDEFAPRRELSSNLVHLRKKAGLTQAQVAQAVGDWDQSFVSKLESATGPWPTSDSVRKFTEACDAGVGYVFFREHDAGTVTLEGAVSFGSPSARAGFERLVCGLPRSPQKEKKTAGAA